MLLSMLAESGLFSTPIWEEPERLMSPGIIGIAGVVFAIWKVWKSQRSINEKMAASLAALAAVGITPQSILAGGLSHLAGGQAQANPVMPPQSMPIQPEAPNTSAAALLLYQQYAALKDPRAAEMGTLYHKLKAQEDAIAPPE